MNSGPGRDAEHSDLREPKVSTEGKPKSEFAGQKHLMWIESEFVKMSENMLCRKMQVSCE